MHQRRDADRRLGPRLAGVVAGPLAERAFHDLVVGRDEALERDLGMGRHRQPGLGHVDDLDALAENAAGHVVLALAVGHLEAGQHEQRGMHAGDDGDRAGLPALVILGHDEAAVLARRHHQAGDVGAVRLDAIAAGVDPAASRGPS